MEKGTKNPFALKISRLLPSSLASCWIRTLPDVRESAINKIPDLSSDSCSALLNHSSSRYVIGRKCPPATPISAQKKEEELQDSSAVDFDASRTIRSSPNGGNLFSSSAEEKTRPGDDVRSDPVPFFSLSSNSGDSFRRREAQSWGFQRLEEMRSIDEAVRCSFSPVASFDAAVSKCNWKNAMDKTGLESDLSSDQISTELYYSAEIGDPERRRRAARSRRKSRRIRSRMMEESCYAVEKRSVDPRGDFRASMVEMIVEKQMDLERLLLCLLELNSSSHHGMILQVFSEICEALFTI